MIIYPSSLSPSVSLSLVDTLTILPSQLTEIRTMTTRYVFALTRYPAKVTHRFPNGTYGVLYTFDETYEFYVSSGEN